MSPPVGAEWGVALLQSTRALSLLGQTRSSAKPVELDLTASVDSSETAPGLKVVTHTHTQ